MLGCKLRLRLFRCYNFQLFFFSLSHLKNINFLNFLQNLSGNPIFLNDFSSNHKASQFLKLCHFYLIFRVKQKWGFCQGYIIGERDTKLSYARRGKIINYA